MITWFSVSCVCGKPGARFFSKKVIFEDVETTPFQTSLIWVIEDQALTYRRSFIQTPFILGLEGVLHGPWQDQ